MRLLEAVVGLMAVVVGGGGGGGASGKLHPLQSTGSNRRGSLLDEKLVRVGEERCSDYYAGSALRQNFLFKHLDGALMDEVVGYMYAAAEAQTHTRSNRLLLKCLSLTARMCLAGRSIK